MVMTRLSAEVLQQLRRLMNLMDQAADELQLLSEQEIDAIRTLNGQQVVNHAEQRVIIHNRLTALEQDCRLLLANAGMQSELSLEQVIDQFAGDETAELQTKRKALRDKILNLEQCSQDNRMRMLATHHITQGFLQQLGIPQQEQTYNRDGVR